jgi:hypothetical protein
MGTGQFSIFGAVEEKGRQGFARINADGDEHWRCLIPPLDGGGFRVG